MLKTVKNRGKVYEKGGVPRVLVRMKCLGGGRRGAGGGSVPSGKDVTSPWGCVVRGTPGLRPKTCSNSYFSFVLVFICIFYMQ